MARLGPRGRATGRKAGLLYELNARRLSGGNKGSRPVKFPPLGHAPRTCALKSLYLGACAAILFIPSARAQGPKPAPAQNPLQQHYEAAQNFQASGNLQSAAVEYRLFISEALHRFAATRAGIGDLAKALPLFEEALNLLPSDVDLRVDYADACRHAGDLEKAKALAEAAIEAEPRNAKAHISLGQTLQQWNRARDATEDQKQAALEQFVEAVGIEPSFEHGFALANAYLRAKDEPKASGVFSDILSSFGTFPEIRIRIGSAYAQAGYPEQAIAQFKKVIAKDPSFPGAHYSLGAAYLVSASDALYPEAAAEFRKELEINPNDFLSRYQLGYIELSQHKLEEAEADLTRAAVLDPKNPDTFVSLGQLYVETNRPSEAESALRKAIALTTDVSRNHYQVQRAHYLLARLLLESGRQDEGKAEIKISQELMQKNVLRNQGRDPGSGMSQAAESGASLGGRNQTAEVAPPAGTGQSTGRAPDAEQMKQEEAFERQIAPAIGDSYNNLGAIAAGSSNFAGALENFKKAYQWNPSLEGLDFNWAKAALSANQIGEAIEPLERYLKAHPDDVWTRSTLGTSLYMLKSYADAVKALQPIESRLDANPELDYVYGMCLVKAGDYDQGVGRLKRLEAKDPGVAARHEALGEIYADHGDFGSAASEFREVIRLSPDDSGAKYNLALSLIQLRQNDEAQALLTGLAAKGWQDPHVYYTLGKLELERGDVSQAITNLETAAKMSPNSGPIHFELAAAYRKGSRNEDADREMKLYESLRSDGSKPGAGKPE